MKLFGWLLIFIIPLVLHAGDIRILDAGVVRNGDTEIVLTPTTVTINGQSSDNLSDTSLSNVSSISIPDGVDLLPVSDGGINVGSNALHISEIFPYQITAPPGPGNELFFDPNGNDTFEFSNTRLAGVDSPVDGTDAANMNFVNSAISSITAGFADVNLSNVVNVSLTSALVFQDVEAVLRSNHCDDPGGCATTTFKIQSGDQTNVNLNSSGSTGSGYIQTGYWSSTIVAGTTGSLSISTGPSSSFAGGTSGSIFLNTGAATNKGIIQFQDYLQVATATGLLPDTWGSDIPAFIIDGTTAAATVAGGSGIVFKGTDSRPFLVVSQDRNDSLKTAGLYLQSGINSGTGGTGSIYYKSGDATGTAGASGQADYGSGGSVSSTSGAVNIKTGNSALGSGLIAIETGTSGTTRGQISIKGRLIETEGHILSTGSAPAVSSCGSGPSISGTDTAGLVTTGTGVFTSCLVTFNVAYTTTPHCFVNNRTTGVVTRGVPTTTDLTINAVFAPSDLVDYFCAGN